MSDLWTFRVSASAKCVLVFAQYFLKMLLKFKMVQNFKVEIIQILQSRSPRYRDVQVFFQGFTEIQSSWMNFIIFCGRKNEKLKL